MERTVTVKTQEVTEDLNGNDGAGDGILFWQGVGRRIAGCRNRTKDWL